MTTLFYTKEGILGHLPDLLCPLLETLLAYLDTCILSFLLSDHCKKEDSSDYFLSET